MTEVKLSRPIEIDGNKIDTIKLDLEKLTGDDILKVERELRLKGVSFNILSQETQIAIAARASGIILDDLQKLHWSDFLDVTAQVQLFLMNMESEEQKTSEKLQ
ncbi:phage tail assembly protein [Thermaerobacillus caldiproteolyticus]|uniref:phage tail assembly protein n=1 Tax=Thermaerobacillus caldiproteolyticus TaxID=247480 RepID=UPI00188D587B|nr:phage tail assembly protein [Anoxybacillus caldiproteolyticus]QPA33434.1 phage tail assembly protein [Anoxybacillus caldiproteolyticus]